MPTPTALPTPSLPIRGSDLRGLVRLGIAATLGVTDLVEAMHHTIASGGGIVWPSHSGRTRRSFETTTGRWKTTTFPSTS